MTALLTAPVFGQRVPPPTPGKGGVESFPADIKSRLKEEFGSWKVQEPENISSSAHKNWESERPLECPGIAIGRFENSGAKSYAVLLVPLARSGEAHKLLVFRRKTGQEAYEFAILDQTNSGETENAGNYFIHKIRIADSFSEQSRKKFNARTRDGILFADSGQDEYETDIYFWTIGRYQHEPVDY